MTCEHRNVTAIPGGRYACTDTLNCEATFTLSSSRDRLRAVNETARLIKAHQKQQRFANQNFTNWQRAERERDSARDAAVILEQMLAEADERLAGRTRESRLDTEKWNTPCAT